MDNATIMYDPERIYVLVNPYGKIRNAAISMEKLTNVFITEFPAGLSDALLDVPAGEQRKAIFEDYGWRVEFVDVQVPKLKRDKS